MAPTDIELAALAEHVGAACRARGRSIGTAESCTGGLVAHVITEVAGSSDYFRGGLVTYADDVKLALVDVPEATLAAHGAVSAQVAVAMADGARRLLRVDVAVAITGVAGPGGGTAAKPVGLTYIAIADADGGDVRRHVWAFDRPGNKRASAAAALALVMDRLAAART